MRHIPPVMLLDMPRSLCALDHAGTGKEGSSAKKKRSRESECAGAEECWMRTQTDRWRRGEIKMWQYGH